MLHSMFEDLLSGKQSDASFIAARWHENDALEVVANAQTEDRDTFLDVGELINHLLRLVYSFASQTTLLLVKPICDHLRQVS